MEVTCTDIQPKGQIVISGSCSTCSCPVCGKSCSSRKNLKVHLRTHTGERPYRCPICRKSFRQHNTLAAHINIHTGQRPYSCRYCVKTFKQSAHRNTHEKNHFATKAEQCPICQRSFSTKGILKRHIHKHTGEKPHQCNVCGRTFSRAESLRNHQLKHKSHILEMFSSGSPTDQVLEVAAPFLEGNNQRHVLLSATHVSAGAANETHFPPSQTVNWPDRLAGETAGDNSHLDSGYSTPNWSPEPPAAAFDVSWLDAAGVVSALPPGSVVSNDCRLPGDYTTQCPTIGTLNIQQALQECYPIPPPPVPSNYCLARQVHFQPAGFYPYQTLEFFSNDLPEPSYGI